MNIQQTRIFIFQGFFPILGFFTVHRCYSLWYIGARQHKLYCKWLMLAVQGKVDEHLGQEQTGYRRGRQASEMVYSALRVTEISREWRQGFVMVKVDLEKAFDTIFQSSIARGLLDMNIVPLAAWGVAREMMEACITPTMYGVQVPSPIEMLRGTRQGSPESGVLFLIGVWQGMKNLVQRWKDEQLGFRVGKEFLSHLIFVDDLIVIARDPFQARDMMNQLRVALGSVGLRINGEKTEYIASMKVPEGLIEGVDSTKNGIKILGRRIRPDNNTNQEVSHRICLANQKFNAIRRVLITKNSSFQHRYEILRSCVFQTVLWTSESWMITKKLRSQLRGAENKWMRQMLDMPKRAPEETMTERCKSYNRALKKEKEQLRGYKPLDEIWILRWLSWMGHLVRLGRERWARKLLLEKSVFWWRQEQRKPEGWRHRGKEGSVAKLENWIVRWHPQHEHWMEGARYRDRWKTQSETVLKRYTEGRGSKIGDDEDDQVTAPPDKKLPGKKRSFGPMAEEILRSNKRQRPNLKEPEWPLLLDLPLADLPMYGAGGFAGKISSAAQQQSACHGVEDQAHELQSSGRRLGATKGRGEEKVEQVVCKPGGEEKRSQSRGPKHKGPSRMERVGAEARCEEGKRQKRRSRSPCGRSRSERGQERLYYCSGSSSGLEQLRSQYHCRAKGRRCCTVPPKDCLPRLDPSFKSKEAQETDIFQPETIEELLHHDKQFQFATSAEKEERPGKRKKAEAPPQSKEEEKSYIEEQRREAQPRGASNAAREKQSSISTTGKRLRSAIASRPSSTSSSSSTTSSSTSMDSNIAKHAEAEPSAATSSIGLIDSRRARSHYSRHWSSGGSPGTIGASAACQPKTVATTSLSAPTETVRTANSTNSERGSLAEPSSASCRPRQREKMGKYAR